MLEKALSEFFKDKDGKIAVVQRPNVWIVLWAGLSLLSKVTDQQTNNGISVLARMSLLVWAYLEITEGVSAFRKVLGAVVMTFTIFGLIFV